MKIYLKYTRVIIIIINDIIQQVIKFDLSYYYYMRRAQIGQGSDDI